jgi:hypothetical protein
MGEERRQEKRDMVARKTEDLWKKNKGNLWGMRAIYCRETIHTKEGKI